MAGTMNVVKHEGKAFLKAQRKNVAGGYVAQKRRDRLFMVWKLVHLHLGPGGNPMENRLRYSMLIRELIRHDREDRLRILGYCAPGVPRRLLP